MRGIYSRDPGSRVVVYLERFFFLFTIIEILKWIVTSLLHVRFPGVFLRFVYTNEFLRRWWWISWKVSYGIIFIFIFFFKLIRFFYFFLFMLQFASVRMVVCRCHRTGNTIIVTFGKGTRIAVTWTEISNWRGSKMKIWIWAFCKTFVKSRDMFSCLTSTSKESCSPNSR